MFRSNTWQLKGFTRPAKVLPLALIFMLAGTGSAFADNFPLTTHHSPLTPQGPTFTLTLADGSVSSGSLEQIGENWSVRLSGAKPVRATGAQAVSLRRDKMSLPDSPRAEQVILVNGDRLPGTVRELMGDQLKVRVNLGHEADLSVPLSAVAIIWKTAPDGVDNADKWRRRLISDKRSRDIAYLHNGDAIEGVLNSITATADQSLQMESSKKDVAVPFSKVAVIAFNTELARPLQPKGVYARLVLTTGCRLTLSSAQTDDHVLQGRTAFGGDVSIPLDHIQAIDWLGGCAIYLSDLKPRAYHFRSFLTDVSWPYMTDVSVIAGNL